MADDKNIKFLFHESFQSSLFGSSTIKMDCSHNNYERLKMYFDEESWNTLSLYEKERCANLKRNYEVLLSTGKHKNNL